MTETGIRKGANPRTDSTPWGFDVHRRRRAV